jgi:hypothetical protein
MTFRRLSLEKELTVFRTIGAVLVIILSSAASIQAQVLTTADTLGKGTQALFVSYNVLREGDARLNVGYGLYSLGLTSRFDVYAGIGQTHTDGKSQAWVAFGGNLNIFAGKNVSVSFLNVESIALNRSDEASVLLSNLAVVVSRRITSTVSIYTGLNAFIPIGSRSRGVFTPTDNEFNVPIGCSFSIGDWSLAVESDIGKLKAIGLGVTRVF